MAVISCFNDLPDCVLLHIFKLLASKVDMWRARNVCTRWYNLLNDSELWRVCDLSKFKFDDLDLLLEAKKHTPFEALQYLELHSRIITADVLSFILETANKIRGLTMKRCIVKHGPANLPVLFKPPSQLSYLDIRHSCGYLGFLETILKVTGQTIKALGLSSAFGKLVNIKGLSYLHYVQNLRVLECCDCSWLNDESLSSLAYYCPHIESLNVTKCLNVQGRSLHKVLTNCRNLKSLILRKTSVREEELIKPTWKELNITELDVSNCYYLNEGSINKMVENLAPQLRYLCCAVNEDLLSRITSIDKPLKLFEVRRRHHVDISTIVDFISTCKYLEALDISLVPIECELLQTMLPNLVKLRWLSMAGHDVLSTNYTLELLSEYNINIEEMGINFYNVGCNEDFGCALKKFISSLPNLKKLCIEGTLIENIVEQLRIDISTDLRYQDSHVQFCEPCDFSFPSAIFSLDKVAEQMAYET